MAVNKKDQFKNGARSLAEFSKAFSHPARLSILTTIAKKKECICGEIVEVLPLAQATVSQHLKELKSAGLISGEVDGNKSCYCLNWTQIEKFRKDLNAFFDGLNKYKTQDQENCC
ncbi:ArsR/SmtB family transcription factor [Leptospira barantonii]|uniref:Transcriptional regulator n=1 Tax=Leptospira barantonii TaxID=2023184 RepID=A0ABX4NM11_9LEPT|nr:metalloregulator ArsR/SmtB family transcription factor [Leptospira barantonii]PJZ57849.1 transcriptional regulator [Leptospira barantonii]